MGLQRYFQKRNFGRTPEPRGREHPRRKRALSFVIQKHDATRLHYDFRLELDGVLKSWAVPKGIPVIKGDKRLAMHVEDHPLEYGGFEGIIPKGNYGAGTVMLWDRGTWELLGGNPQESLKKGKLHFRLKGEKLKGEWTLVRMRGREELGKEPWLLIKSGEDTRAISAKMDNHSVSSGKTLEEIAGGQSRIWHSNREAAAEKSKPSPGRNARQPKVAPKSRAPRDLVRLVERFPGQLPAYVEPMKAVLVEKAPQEKGWVYEIKWDGYRALTVRKGDSIRLYSRRARDITKDFPEIAEAVTRMPVSSIVLDGELVAVDKQGHASFQLLQNFKDGSGNGHRLLYYVFDILNLENHDLKKVPFTERKRILEAVLKNVSHPIRYSSAFEGDPEAKLSEA